MIWLLMATIVIASVCVVMTLSAVNRNAELRGSVAGLSEQLRVASWLANYQARYTWAMQDYMAAKEHISYMEVYKRAKPWLLASGQSRVSLFVPMDRVPAELREAASLYNTSVWGHLSEVWQGPISTDETEEQRKERLMEAAVQLMTYNLGRYTKRIHARTKEDPDVIGGTLDVLEGYLTADIRHLMGVDSGVPC